MRTITMEEHISTPEFLEAMAESRQGDPVIDLWRANRDKLFDVGKDRIADMDAAGIDMQVLSLSGGMDKLNPTIAAELARDTNDKLADAVRAHPNRFAAFATLALQDPEKAAIEFERCVRQLGFKGALVNGTSDGQFLDHRRFSPLFETAQALDVPIYLHPAPPAGRCEESILRGIARRSGVYPFHPRLGVACGNRDALSASDRFRSVRSFSRAKDHYRAHGGSPAILSCSRRRFPWAERDAPQVPHFRLFPRAFLHHYERMFYSAPIPVCLAGRRRRPTALFRGLSIRLECRGTCLLERSSRQRRRSSQDFSWQCGAPPEAVNRGAWRRTI